MITRLFSVIVVLMMVISIIGCSEDAANQSSILQDSIATSETGVIQVRMHDAPPEYDITEVWVTIKQIEIHSASAKANNIPDDQPTNSGSGMAGYSPWITLTMVGTAPIELMQYQDGLEALLADHELDPGKYTQIRLSITDVEVVYTEASGTETQRAEAKLPSDKLKFTKPFDIIAGGTTILSFDFSIEDSIVITGAGEVIVKPVLTLEVSYEGGVIPEADETPTGEPTPNESSTPKKEQTGKPTPDESPTPKKEQTGKPSPDESPKPKKEQTGKPTPVESPTPEDEPTDEPTPDESPTPEDAPTDEPTPDESPTPEDEPTDEPTPDEPPTPEDAPTDQPTPDEVPTPDNKPDFVPTPGKDNKKD